MYVIIASGRQMGGYLVLVTAGLTWISLLFKKCVFTFSGVFHNFFLVVLIIVFVF